MTRTLFIQFSLGKWTDEELEDVMEIMGDELPDDVKVVGVPKDLDFLTEEQVEHFIEQLQ